MFDWYLARKFNSKSKLWKTLDSFADILIYLLPVINIYAVMHWVSIHLVLISSLLFMAWLYRLSYFTDNWIKTIKNKKNYELIPVYYLFILNIVLFIDIKIYVISEIFISLLFINFSLLMISKYNFRKFNMFVWITYLVILFLITLLFIKWI